MKRRILAFFILLILIGLTVGMKLSTSPKVDLWLQRTVLEQLERHLHVKASLGGFEKNLLMTRVTFTDVTLEDTAGSGKSIKTSRLVIQIDPYAFLRGTLHLRSVQLEGVSLNITRKADGSINIDPLFPLNLGEMGGDGKPVVPIKFKIGEVTLIDGSVSFTDVSAGFIVTMDDVVISLTQGHFDPKDERDISVRSRRGEFRWRVLPAGESIGIESFRANLVYSPIGLTVKELKMATRPLSLELSGVLPFQGEDEVRGDVSLRVDLGGLPGLLPDSSGEVTLAGSAGGKLTDPSFKGKLTGEKIRLSGREMRNLGAEINTDVRGCRISGIAVEYRGEHVDGTLSLTFRRGMPYTLEASTNKYPLIKLAEEVHRIEFPLGGDVSADLRVSGNLSGGASSISMTGEMNLPVGDGNMMPAQLELAGQYATGDLKDLDLEISAGSFRLGTSGSLTSNGPDLKIEAVQEDLEFLNNIKVLSSLNGSFVLDAEVAGPWDNVQAGIDATVRQIRWENYFADAVRVHIDVNRKGVSLPMVSVEAGTSTLVGEADLPWNRKSGGYRFAMEITDGRVEDLLNSAGVDPVVSGQVMGRVEALFTEDGWEGNAEALIQNGKVLEEDYDGISLTGVFRDGRFNFNKLDIVKADRHVYGKGWIDEGRFEGRFTSHEPVTLESITYLRNLKVFLSGEVDMETTVRGNMDGTDLALDTALTWDQITFDGRPWQGGSADFSIRDRRLRGKGSLLDGIFNAQVEVELDGDLPFSGTIQTGKVADRDALNNLLGVRIPADTVSGTLKADAEAAGILKNLRRTRVKGTIGNADLWIKGIHFHAPEAVSFTYYPDTGIRFIDAALWSGESILAGTLLIAPGAEIEGNLNGNVDLTGFAFLKPTVDGFSGQSLVQLQVSGRLAEPVLNGSIRLRGVKCTAHIPFDLPVSELTGDLEIVGNRLQSGGLNGTSGDGLIHMEGDLILKRFKPVQGELRWRAEAVPVQFPEGLNTVNRADIALRFSEGLGVLRGTISMDEGRFTRQVDIDNLIALIGERTANAKNGSSAERRDQRGDWLTLDIEMETATPIVIDIKLLRGTARGNLHLQGTASRPVLAGRLEMDEGTIEYRGHSFSVISGSVGFFNPVQIEPAFDFSARTEVTGLDRDGTVTDYTVDLLATGVPEKFRLDLVSSPPLSEIDIVSLLTWGAVGEQAFASRTGLSAAEATLLLTRELKGTLETGVRQLTGFDRVVINPSAVTSSGERTTRIQVDKKISDSFYLTYSTPVLTSAEQEVLIKYRISDSFSLIGEQTGEEDYGLDLDFQFQIP